MRVALAATMRCRAEGRATGRLAPLGHELIDLGGDGSNPEDDYPDFSLALGWPSSTAGPTEASSSAAAASGIDAARRYRAFARPVPRHYSAGQESSTTT